jgi:hypothetical protein
MYVCMYVCMYVVKNSLFSFSFLIGVRTDVHSIQRGFKVSIKRNGQGVILRRFQLLIQREREKVVGVVELDIGDLGRVSCAGDLDIFVGDGEVLGVQHYLGYWLFG